MLLLNDAHAHILLIIKVVDKAISLLTDGKHSWLNTLDHWTMDIVLTTFQLVLDRRDIE